MTYVAKETPMVMYLNAHGGLETLRRCVVKQELHEQYLYWFSKVFF